MESAPSVSFAGLSIQDLARLLAHPWFAKVTHSNTRNRAIVRGKGKKARVASEPLKIATRVGTQIEPGQTRFEALERLNEQAGSLMWSSGDGRELFIGKPSYDQEIQFRFYRPAQGSRNADKSTVQGMRVARSTGDRFSRVIVVGSGRGTHVNFGPSVAARQGEAKNNPLTVDGEGKDFIAPKRLVIVRSVKSIAEAKELAEGEMARRDAAGNAITVRCAGHGQRVGGSYVTVFAIDTLAAVHDEVTGTVGVFTIVSCSYTSAREGAEETTMEIVRRGTELTR
jgi:prophage tail gpP-like protein